VEEVVIRQLLLLVLIQNLAELGVAQVATEPQQATVCQILENLAVYNGKVVAIQVVNLDFTAQCQLPATADDPRIMQAGAPPVNEISVAVFTNFDAMTDPLRKALADYDRWFRQGYDVTMKVVGRIDARHTGSPLGFGHLGAYPAQITITRIEDVKRSAKKGPKRKIIYIE
jgi:hypothetical protein